MSVEKLRSAAAAIRADHDPWHAEGEPPCDHPSCENDRFMLAVADWLERSARTKFVTFGGGLHVDQDALVVARAYLGESA